MPLKTLVVFLVEPVGMAPSVQLQPRMQLPWVDQFTIGANDLEWDCCASGYVFSGGHCMQYMDVVGGCGTSLAVWQSIVVADI
jgi:hypothetical protein